MIYINLVCTNCTFFVVMVSPAYICLKENLSYYLLTLNL